MTWKMKENAPWKMTAKSQPENDKMENAHPENGRKITSGKWQKKHTRKMTEKAHLENEGMENVQHRK